MLRSWLLRVASTPDVGGGHVRRCLALAEALSEYGPTTVVLDIGGDRWREIIEKRGVVVAFENEPISGPWAGSILDGYRFTTADVQQLSKLAPPVVMMDDFSQPLTGVDLVINPASNATGVEVAGKTALLGPRYALLDRDYRDVPLSEPRTDVEKLVYCFGMQDSANAMKVGLDAFKLIEDRLRGVELKAVLSASAPHRRIVAEQVSQMESAELVLDAPGMADLYQSIDLAVGAGGVGLFERLACGVPSITVCTAANQRQTVAAAADFGATRSAGDIADLQPPQLARDIEELANDTSARRAMTICARRLVDGRGADRTAAALVAFSRRYHSGAPFDVSVVTADVEGNF